jgi:3D-(3,5/4)-trihydroxycyclohexane-1,2-dione acylhydrolase (decyclizing)
MRQERATFRFTRSTAIASGQKAETLDKPTPTIRLTQALVSHLVAQRIVVEGREQPLFGGAFAIFGHGNGTCLGEALHQVRPPSHLARPERAVDGARRDRQAKTHLRRRIMVATSSIGPAATNMVTAAAVAPTNRPPLLLLAGDTYHHRLPNSVLQQVERFDDPTISVNDAFKPVTRYCDRITHPALGLPQASSRPEVLAAAEALSRGRVRQRQGV